jgi:hypothetical protein
VELNSPSSQKNGAILIEKKNTNYKTKIGTKITFLHKTKKMPNSYSIPSDHKLTKAVSNKFDPIVDESFDIEIALLIDRVSLTSSKSDMPFALYFNKKFMIDSEGKSMRPFAYFSKNHSMEISTGLHYNRVFYKNQFVDKNKLTIFKFINFDINILGDDAINVLTIDRNSIREEYNKKLEKKVLKVAYEYLTKEYDTFKDTDKIKVSMFLNYYYDRKKVEKYDAWKGYELKTKEAMCKLGDLFNDINELEIINHDVLGGAYKQDIYQKENSKLTIDIKEHGNQITSFILSIISRYFKTVNFDMINNKKSFTKKEGEHKFTEDDIYEILKKQKEFNFSRSKIPCLKKYEKLRLKTDAHKSWLRELDINAYRIKIPSMLSPYFSLCEDEDYMFSCRNAKLEYRVNDKLIEWVYKNRYDKKTTKAEIKSAYEQFKADFSNETI